jgi:spore coat polysaccharide biosynthesis protein SpsF (cytidylyltransferase family)
MSTVAIAVQARLGSTRLPGKVLRPLAGRPMLEQILNQVRAVPRSTLAVAASDAQQDQALVEFARERQIISTRGPADDIVGRMARAARAAGSSDALIRVWGDCPFVCADIIERMLERFFAESLDFIHLGTKENRTLPVGLDAEIYRTSWLLDIDQRVADAYLREFPFELVREAGERFRWQRYTPPSPLAPQVNLTVDYPEDLAAAERVYEAIGHHPFRSDELFDVLTRQPALLQAFSSAPRQAEFNQKAALRRAQS